MMDGSLIALALEDDNARGLFITLAMAPVVLWFWWRALRGR